MSPLMKAFRAVMGGGTLSRDEASRAVEEMLGEAFSEVVAAGLLVALARRGESPDEVAGFVDVLRDRLVPLPAGAELAARAIDVCGTGGDSRGTFNVSTAAALVVAGAGVPVAKHGGRAVSSSSGSADVLTALGVNIEMPHGAAARALAETGMTFLFAPVYHQAMRRVAPLRRELGVRTAFNLAGPLANPARVKRQLIGVDRPERVEMVARALAELGAERAYVLSNEAGGDELLPFGKTVVAEVDHGEVRTFTLAPADFGVPEHDPASLSAKDPADSASIVRALLDGERGPRRDTVLMNAAAALVVAGAAESLAEGMEKAAEAVDSGAARKVLEELVRLSREPA